MSRYADKLCAESEQNSLWAIRHGQQGYHYVLIDSIRKIEVPDRQWSRIHWVEPGQTVTLDHDAPRRHEAMHAD